MKKPFEPKRITFRIAEGVNAFFGNGDRHLHLAPGVYTTDDLIEQRFLLRYPGVSVESVEPISTPTPIQNLREASPGPPAVITGGLSGGGAASIPTKH